MIIFPQSLSRQRLAVHILLLITMSIIACTTEKIVYVLPDGSEVTPTSAQAAREEGEGSQAEPHQREEATVQPTPAPTATASASREDTLLNLIIENKPPTITGYGFQQRVDYTPDCAEVFYIFGSSISGRPPKFTYAAPAQGLYDVVIKCDDDGNHYFTEERYIDMLWEYLSR